MHSRCWCCDGMCKMVRMSLVTSGADVERFGCGLRQGGMGVLPLSAVI